MTDTGPGVDPKIKDVMYEAFMTTKPKGMGLGLALARKYLEGNGGTVTHETGPKGSTFSRPNILSQSVDGLPRE